MKQRSIYKRVWVSFLFGDQEQAVMGHLMRNGPLVVIVDAVSWQDNLGGIIQDCFSSRKPNHTAPVVGFNTAGTRCQHMVVRIKCEIESSSHCVFTIEKYNMFGVVR